MRDIDSLPPHQSQGVPHPTPTLPDKLEKIVALQPYVGVASRPGTGAWMKRSIDIILGSAILLLVLPVMMALVIAIKFNSAGPVLFVQRRVGKGGKIFKLYKFRSMIIDAEDLKTTLQNLNEKDGPIFKMVADPRITTVGKFMRSHSLDELPQLFNVLFNDMSLVGPRPPLPEEVLNYEPWHLKRLAVKPGLTCTWQISGRSNLSFEEWMRLDVAYIDNWSIGLDLKLIWKTIRVVLNADGAY
jgi:lipopolysaccharide/colanic/teichoic acid biosynthesis glycosyltransferase